MPSNPPGVDKAMVERAAQADCDSFFGEGEFWRIKEDQRSTFRMCVRAALTAALGETHVVVPKSALNWLNGEGPDADGKWFGECEDAERLTPCKYSRAYWWRTKFRSLITASQNEGG